MSFFGYEIEPNKPYLHVPPEGTVLKLTNAALAHAGEDGKRTQLQCKVDGKAFVVVNFIGGKVEHAIIDLVFEGKQEVQFIVSGETPVHLTGYYNLMEDDFDDLNDEELEGLYGDNSDSDDEGVDAELLKQLQAQQKKSGSKLKIEQLGEESSDEEPTPGQKKDL